jgi:hypothetical protein
VEKTWKAYVVSSDRPFPHTHNLIDLLTLCIAVQPRFSTFLETARRLTPYATAFRYPTDEAVPAVATAIQDLQLARDAYEFVLDLMPSEAKP